MAATAVTASHIWSAAEGGAQAVRTLAKLLAGMVIYVGTIVWSRVAKAKGGAT